MEMETVTVVVHLPQSHITSDDPVPVLETDELHEKKSQIETGTYVRSNDTPVEDVVSVNCVSIPMEMEEIERPKSPDSSSYIQVSRRSSTESDSCNRLVEPVSPQDENVTQVVVGYGNDVPVSVMVPGRRSEEVRDNRK